MKVSLGARSHGVKVAAALGLVYVVWGSTYLAIRVTVETLPPLTTAGIRFVTAGALVYALIIRRTPMSERPTPAHWRSAAIIGGGLLLGGNGLVVLAASSGVPSGTLALLVGTVPLWMALIGRFVYRERIPPIAVAGIVVGFTGVAILAKPSGDFPISGSLMVIGAALTWSAASLHAKRAPLPKSALLATAMEMLAGGALQIMAGGIRGEWGSITPSAFSRSSLIALAYLILIGSLVGFTAYIWLLHNTRTSLVSTYAFVNPVIAVMLGIVFANESLTPRTLIAGSIIVGSVALIISARQVRAEPAPSV